MLLIVVDDKNITQEYSCDDSVKTDNKIGVNPQKDTIWLKKSEPCPSKDIPDLSYLDEESINGFIQKGCFDTDLLISPHILQFQKNAKRRFVLKTSGMRKMYTKMSSLLMSRHMKCSLKFLFRDVNPIFFKFHPKFHEYDSRNSKYIILQKGKWVENSGKLDKVLPFIIKKNYTNLSMVIRYPNYKEFTNYTVDDITEYIDWLYNIVLILQPECKDEKFRSFTDKAFKVIYKSLKAKQSESIGSSYDIFVHITQYVRISNLVNRNRDQYPEFNFLRKVMKNTLIPKLKKTNISYAFKLAFNIDLSDALRNRKTRIFTETIFKQKHMTIEELEDALIKLQLSVNGSYIF
jgi:hypothetical protein